MKSKLLMILVLLLSGSMAFAQVTGQVDIQVTNGGVENADALDGDQPCSFDIFFQNSDTLGGYSIGFVIWTPDWAGWDYDSAIFNIVWNPVLMVLETTYAVITAVPGSRQYPQATVWDNGGLQVTLQDTAHHVAGVKNMDSLLFGGTRQDHGLYPGDLEKQIQIHFVPRTGGSICIDSTKIGPAGDFVFSDIAGGTFKPSFLLPEGGKCWPVNATGTDDNSPAVPFTFGLKQNYPNPFNPATTILYSLAKKADVKLIVYNVLGQNVKTLVNGEQEANEYEIIWNGDDNQGHAVASGIYFYKLVTNEFIATKKMMLMR